MKLKFDREQVATLVAAITDPNRYIQIVKDEGIYLMASFVQDNPVKVIVYAKGFNPKTDGDVVWEASRDAVGGDDFCDKVATLKEMADALANSVGDIFVSVSANSISLSYKEKPGKSVAPKAPVNSTGKLTKEEVAVIQQEVRLAMAEVLAKHNLKLSKNMARYSDSEFALRLSFVRKGEELLIAARKFDYELTSRFGLKVGDKLMSSEGQVTLTGMKGKEKLTVLTAGGKGLQGPTACWKKLDGSRIVDAWAEPIKPFVPRPAEVK